MVDPLDDPQHCAAVTLHHFGREGGYPAGDFATSLMTTVCKADARNLARLMVAYPQLTSAVIVARENPDGIAMLQRNAKGEAA